MRDRAPRIGPRPVLIAAAAILLPATIFATLPSDEYLARLGRAAVTQ